MAVATSTALLIAAGAAGAMAAKSASDQGNAQNRAASKQAEMARQKGIQETALAYDRARSERSQADSFQSDLIAQAAAFGGGTSDMAVTNMLVDADARGEYNALTQIFEGQSRQKDLNYQADLTQFEGRSARRAGNMKAFSTVLDTASNMGSRFAGEADKGDKDTAKAKPKAGK